VEFTDKTLTCVECKTPFVFSARDQEFHASKGFANEPKRCPACRQARRVQRGDTPASGRPKPEPVYTGPRAQGRPAGPGQRGSGGRPRGRREGFERRDRSEGGAEYRGSTSFSGANGAAQQRYTANCSVCGKETDVEADAGNRVIFCPECYSKMTALARS
jgi:DNA-directed RNA polymerase subunit RPC12/RpoP